MHPNSLGCFRHCLTYTYTKETETMGCYAFVVWSWAGPEDYFDLSVFDHFAMDYERFV